MDITKLSDQDLAALHAKQYDKLSDEGLQYLHGQQSPPKTHQQELLDKYAPELHAKSFAELPKESQDAFTAGMGGVANAAGEGLGTIVSGIGRGLKSGGDILLQRAVGLKRFIPGVGETLADEGVIGTKGMMRNQVEQGLAKRGQEIGELAKGIQKVDTQPIAERLGERAAKLVGPDGEIAPDNIKAFHKYVDAAKDAMSEDAISGETAAFRRAEQGRIARESGRYRDNPSQSLKAQIAGEQQAGYSNALKNAPGAPPELAEADKAYGALSQANKAMAAPESITSMGIAGKAVPAALGASIGGAPGAAAGALLNTPLAQSTLGRALIGLGRAGTSNAVQQTSTYAPTALQEFLGRKNQSTEDR